MFPIRRVLVLNALFGRLRTGFLGRDASGSKFSDWKRLSAFRSGRHQHGQLLQGGGGGGGPDGSGHPSDSQGGGAPRDT